jgi:endogenous inhibitor of DNA gyrase (YacG/DUF329 family)
LPLEYYVICTNPSCRCLISLLEAAQVGACSKLVINQCPECGYPWSGKCPICGQLLATDSREKPHCCAHCGGALRPSYKNCFERCLLRRPCCRVGINLAVRQRRAFMNSTRFQEMDSVCKPARNHPALTY